MGVVFSFRTTDIAVRCEMCIRNLLYESRVLTLCLTSVVQFQNESAHVIARKKASHFFQHSHIISPFLTVTINEAKLNLCFWIFPLYRSTSSFSKWLF